MQVIRLQGTELVVSRLSFGTASLHHVPLGMHRRNLLAVAVDQGISHFDTSPYYGFGLAERTLGEFLGNHSSSLTIASKVGMYAPQGSYPGTLQVWGRKLGGQAIPTMSRAVVDWSVKRAVHSLDLSLARLKRDCLDVLFLHEPQAALIKAEETLRWLERERSAGRIRYWGVAGEPKSLLPLLDGRNPLAQVVQARDSLTGEEAARIRSMGITIHFAYGYLSAAKGSGSNLTIRSVLQEALKRNPTGSILVSARSVRHVRAFARGLSERSDADC